jgi:ribosomal protein L11 methyltransferase
LDYFAIHIELDPVNEEIKDVLSALLDDNEYEGICEGETGLIAYISSDRFSENVLEIFREYLDNMGCRMDWKKEIFPEQNWNAVWESNFEPVIINEKCVIRAPFHESFANYPFCLTIEPKMSFGTGHHQTTRLMIEEMFHIDFNGRKILDIGCGTGVLGILAYKLGASEICCIDMDEWAIRNTAENIRRNNTPDIRVIQGDKNAIPAEIFNIILANINRNILMDQLECYAKATIRGSQLIISGFLEEDIPALNHKMAECGFVQSVSRSLNGWSIILCNRI